MTHLQEELKSLRESLTDMADLVQKQIKKSICSLIDKDEDLANEVLFNEKRVNALELKIDKDCENIFALLTPVAHDMRFVFATLKINADLERIGDYAEGIAQLVLLGKKSFDENLINELDLRNMYDVAYAMLEDVTNAYSDDDSKLARSVFARDLQLNEINRVAADIVIEYSKKNMDKMKEALLLLSIIRKLERVGDHITNIAEEVIFHKEAKILKHGNKGEELR
ncbi:MAG: phosphate signaling complex protein PhoU [Chitinophagaceae bacterium]|jgi:phosphate transport system protein